MGPAEIIATHAKNTGKEFQGPGREVSNDNVISLAFYTTTKLGKQISSIPVMERTATHIAIDVYNR